MLKLFSGTTNPVLSQEVAQLLGIPLAKAEVVRFATSEVRVRIEEDVKDSTCVVIQPTSNPTDTNLMELILFCDSLRRQEAKRVIGFIPWFGYARQDIQHRQGECVSANAVIRILESTGFHKIYVCDLHDEATEGVFSIPFKNVSTLPLLADKTRSYIPNCSPDTVKVISPDQGGIERARKFGISLFGTESFSIAVIEKKRDQDHIHQSKALDLYGDVSGKVAVLVDDMTTSGGTLIHAAELCMSKGATKVIAAIVHHDFTNETSGKIQDSHIEKFFTTNTITLKDEFKFPKLEEISIASLIADELKKFVG